ncbi:unnamed protein product [marine sediment metagenome]|uniref:Uncharacterized protein n=1 Tax=marine sediment metagenome TaxID=412755 RepID=X0SP28_9ZZZZ
MKVESKTLKKTLVFAGGTRVSKKAYENILRDVAAGTKEKACTEATQLVVKEANIDGRIVADVLASLNEIRNRRGAALFPPPNTCSQLE